MEMCYAFVYYILIALVVWRMPFFGNSGLSWWQLQILLALKMAAGIALYGVYAFYYGDRNTSDALRFFDDAAIIHRLFPTDFSTWAGIVFGWDTHSPAAVQITDTLSHWHRERFTGLLNDNRLMIRLNALIMLFSRGNYYIHMVVMVFLSFAGLTGIFRGLAHYLPTLSRRWLMAAVFLLPGVWFWSSGVLKEGLMFCVLGLQFHFLIRVLSRQNTRTAIFGFALLMPSGMMVKPYVFIIFWAMSTWLLISNFYQHRLVFSWILFHLLASVLVLGTDTLLDHRLLELLVQKQHDFIAVAQAQNAGSAFTLLPLDTDWASVFVMLPTALYNTLLRPMIWEAHNPLALLTAIENTGILLLLILAVVFRRRGLKSEKEMFLFALGFAMWLFALAGLTTPIAGALVRYKVPVLPFLIPVLLSCLDVNRLRSILRLSAILPFLFFFSCIKPEKADLVIHNADIRYFDPAESKGKWGEVSAEAAAYSKNVLIERGPEHQIMNRYLADTYRDMKKRTLFLPSVQVLDFGTDSTVDVDAHYVLGWQASVKNGHRPFLKEGYKTLFYSAQPDAVQHLSRDGARGPDGSRLNGLSVNLADTGWERTLRLCALLGFGVHLRNADSTDTLQLQTLLQAALEGPNDRRWLIEIPCHAPDFLLRCISKYSLIPIVDATCDSDFQWRCAQVNRTLIIKPSPLPCNPRYTLHTYSCLMAMGKDSLAMGYHPEFEE
jgi:hypothetical protein